MKQRTFLITLVLFLFFFNLGISIFSVVTYRDTISSVKGRSLGEHYFIVSSLIKDFKALESRGIEIEEGSISEILQPYSYLSEDKKAGLALYQNDELTYFNQDLAVLQSISPGAPENGARLVAIQKAEGKTYVIVTGRLPQPYDAYSLVYLYDTTDSISTWNQLKNVLFLAGFLLSILLALGLIIALNQIFKPLSQISQTSKNIANGAYETRLQVSGHDELSEMARSFNHMAEEIQHQMTALLEASNKKQQFIDNFAHELRTPLTAIYGYAEYMQKAVMTEDDRISALDYIMSESRRLQTIAFQLLELANLQNNQIVCEENRMSDLFELVRQTLNGKIVEKNIHIEFLCELDAVRGDRYLLESLLVNLTDNAIKACTVGGNITVRAYWEEKKKILSIQDNGIGMTDEVLSQITEPFYRGDKARSRKDGGAGLGLAICSQIAAQHDASLSFTSHSGKGTTVKVTFTTL